MKTSEDTNELHDCLKAIFQAVLFCAIVLAVVFAIYRAGYQACKNEERMNISKKWKTQ